MPKIPDTDNYDPYIAELRAAVVAASKEPGHADRVHALMRAVMRNARSEVLLELYQGYQEIEAEAAAERAKLPPDVPPVAPKESWLERARRYIGLYGPY